MNRLLPRFLTLSFLLAFALIPFAVFAQTIESDTEDSDVDDAAPATRVARLSFVDGDVSFLRAGVTEWAPVVENLPLLAGDQLYAGRGARAEIQLGRGNYIRLSESTALTITDLSDSGAQFELTEGTAIIRIERLSSAFRRYEIDTPNSAILLQKDGLYRIDVRGESDSELIVRRGQAEVSTDEGSLKVGEGRKLLVDTATGGKLELATATTHDDWDQWSYDRDATIARTISDLAPAGVSSYETTYDDFYGASDLSSYGTWTNYSSYGQCWVPRVSSDWAPYRSGQWLWIPSAGWSWLSSEPWGWAPYHYGRWAYLSGLGWAWIPGFGSAYRGYGHRDYHWRPALVGFFNYTTPRGNYVGWYPLAPGERWHRPDREGRRDDRVHPPLPSPRDRRVGLDHGLLAGRHREMTILPAEGFARGDRSVRPVAPGRDVSDLINKGARRGLPEIKPNPIAVAPILGENDHRRSGRLAVPSNEIIRRPVLTRNTDTESSKRADAPRERRLISPRGPSLIERGSDRAVDRRPKSAAPAGGSQADANSNGGGSPRVHLLLPTPSTSSNGDGKTYGGKRGTEGDAAEAGGERRRARPEQPSTSAPTQSESSSEKARDGERRSRERRTPGGDSGSEEDKRSRDRADQQATPRDGARLPRVEPRQEHPSTDTQDQAREERRREKQQRQEQESQNQARQERHQEKQQRQEQPRTENQARPEHHEEKQQRQERQQQQEQRKKP